MGRLWDRLRDLLGLGPAKEQEVESEPAGLSEAAPELAEPDEELTDQLEARQLSAEPRSEPSAGDAHTQFAEAGEGDVTDVVIGFDLGTSSTKVVLRTPYVGGARCVAVPFVDGRGLERYLLPARLYESRDGEFSLEPLAGGTSHDNPKWRFMRDRDRGEALLLMCGYAALVLRSARRWFLTAERENYGHFELRWSMNIGLPSANFSNRRMTREMRRLAQAAWSLSCSSENVSRSSTLRALEGEITASENVDIGVFPEVVAAVAGHAHTHLREEGLQMLVDVGASTLDVCSFRLYAQEGQDRYDTLTARVKSLGIHVLHRRRLAVVDGDVAQSELEIDLADPFAEVPGDGDAYARTKADAAAIARVDREHTRRCSNAIFRDLLDLKKRRAPRSRRWRADGAGLPVFLTGGGRESEFYGTMLDEVEKRFTSAVFAPGFDRRDLPLPRNLHAPGLRPHDFGRLSVAYGLSVPDVDFGRVIPRGQVPDGRPIERVDPGDFVSKDQV